MQKTGHEIVEIIEGSTRILVPERSITDIVPPTMPAFFNPRAKMNRDLSILAYSAATSDFQGTRVFIDCMAGLGSLGLRVANELQFERVIVNDLNPGALELAAKSAGLNGLKNITVTEKEACRVCSDFSGKGNRAIAVDIDPFGSPARFIDCGIRATMHGGILSMTATDLQVLNGLFQNACVRRYGGSPVRTKYGNETAIRLILGCIRHVAARMDIEIIPLFVESHMHYYRVFVRILNRPDQEENVGYITHCSSCGNRVPANSHQSVCDACNSKVVQSGPLWTGRLFERGFVEKMIEESNNFNVQKKCKKLLSIALLESDMPAAYYTLDEIASRMKASPIGLDEVIDRLSKGGFKASPTSFNPTGFKTDAPIQKIKDVFCD